MGTESVSKDALSSDGPASSGLSRGEGTAQIRAARVRSRDDGSGRDLGGHRRAVAAIADSKIFTANAVFVFSSLNTWGWIVLGLGALLLLAAFTVFTGSQFARWFGIVAAGLNGIGQLFFIQAYPLWSLAMFAADIVIIYALATYAGPKLKRL